MKRILLVDDSKLFYRFVKDVFKNDDVEILWAKNGEEAIKKFNEFNPDLTMVDIILSDSNGVEIIKRLREIKPEANIMVISGLDKESVIKDALEAGAKDYLVKNVSISYFRQKIMDNID
ncbi:response regulator containing CheY-like receiver domain and AraC-type DNA-binding domain [Aciduliprofundum sp. MAR08-339]|uniref:response regulator n=1 Tax=Aciduliprofundum sp. (strain MAR08-339) TaxID=673860 RepID=UPI0002A4C22B|nr:response regulator containing CheY-like receiver domain and AraC-type DNA-binding domain [Aciduliprofundum sp. MAR08-339]